MPKVPRCPEDQLQYATTYLELCSLDSRAREQTISGGERGRCGSPPTDCEDAHESQDEAAEADGVTSLLGGLEGGGISGSVADVLQNILEIFQILDPPFLPLSKRH